MPSDVAVPVPVVAAGVLSGETAATEPKFHSVIEDASAALHAAMVKATRPIRAARLNRVMMSEFLKLFEEMIERCVSMAASDSGGGPQSNRSGGLSLATPGDAQAAEPAQQQPCCRGQRNRSDRDAAVDLTQGRRVE